MNAYRRAMLFLKLAELSKTPSHEELTKQLKRYLGGLTASLVLSPPIALGAGAVYHALKNKQEPFKKKFGPYALGVGIASIPMVTRLILRSELKKLLKQVR